MTLFRHRRKLLLGAIALLVIGSSLWRLTTRHSKDKQSSQKISVEPLVDPLAQDPSIQAFFNHSEASVYTEPYRQIARHGDDLEQVIVSAIEQSTTSVDVAVQALNLPRVAQALVDSVQRGVTVRLILENQYAVMTGADVDTAQAEILQILSEGNVPLLDDTADGSKGSGLMHHKFLVIDQRWVLVGSANLTLSGVHGDADVPESRGNANVLLKIDSGAIAHAFTKEFDLMWGDGPGDRPDSLFGLQKPYRPPQSITMPSGSITLQFSPVSASTQPWENSVNGLIATTLNQADHSIDLALFVFSEQKIADSLQHKVNTGTALRALIDPGFVYRSYSEALDMLGLALPDQRCQIEEHNRPWQVPIDTVGSPRLPAGDKLHHKFAVIDDTTVIVGSQNWSHAANTKNDESLLVINNSAVAAHFNREFERLYQTSVALGHTPLIEQKLIAEQSRCS